MNLKKEAAEYATKYVKDGSVVGLGTGSTAAYFIKKLGERVREEELDIIGIPTSYDSILLAREENILTSTLDNYDIDIAIDGADAIDYDLNLIKGGGAAHTIEKIIDNAATEFYVIADESKYMEDLSDVAVPVEVIPSATRVVLRTLDEMGSVPVLRMGVNKAGPVVTDNGNFIIDAKFSTISDSASLESNLNLIPGVVENGLFIEMADKIILGTKDGIKEY